MHYACLDLLGILVDLLLLLSAHRLIVAGFRVLLHLARTCLLVGRCCAGCCVIACLERVAVSVINARLLGRLLLVVVLRRGRLHVVLAVVLLHQLRIRAGADWIRKVMMMVLLLVLLLLLRLRVVMVVVACEHLRA